jgi:hypothetical protein
MANGLGSENISLGGAFQGASLLYANERQNAGRDIHFRVQSKNYRHDAFVRAR